MRKFLLYYHTAKYLKFKQIYYRFFYFVCKPKVSQYINKTIIRKIPQNLKENFLLKDKIFFENNIAQFINHRVDISMKNIWNDQSQSGLWLYNLHYFDALHSFDSKQQQFAYQLLERWIDENPVFLGVGWQPFPISLRIVNIIKYALSGKIISEKVKNSLYLQARYLNKKCEYHLLGNHLFENFKALCLAGLFFDTQESNKWYQKGLKGLSCEIETQVLNDGGHFELSPMYHCLFLEGLLDLHNIFYGYQKEFLWKNIVEKMLDWLNAVKRNDQEISYFNDASNNIAPMPSMLFLYSKKLGYLLKTKQDALTYLNNSGFVVAKKKYFKIITDVGHIGPDYLPGHGHADTLSFELYFNDVPVFINLGTSCYGNSDRRLFERGTSAHNTIVIDEKNSSQVWSGFRVAKRARIKEVNFSEKNGEFFVDAMHDGYSCFRKELYHRRSWQISQHKIIISDNLNRSFQSAAAYFHLHPDCKIDFQTENKIILQLKNNHRLQCESSHSFDVIESQYAQSFGHLENTRSLKVNIDLIKCSHDLKLTLLSA